jgi:hypothetical protein
MSRVTVVLIGNIGAAGVVSREGHGFCGTYGFISEDFGAQRWSIRRRTHRV